MYPEGEIRMEGSGVIRRFFYWLIGCSEGFDKKGKKK